MKAATTKERDQNRTRQGLIIGGMLLLSLLCLGIMLFGPLVFSFGGMGSFPVALHSILHADYSADAMSFALPAVQLGLIGNALQDQQATGAVDREATIIAELLTPVPTVTPQFWLSPTPSLPPQATYTLPPRLPTGTATPSPISTEQPTYTSTPTRTITPLPTYTDIVPTGHPSNTPTQPPPTSEPTQIPPTEPPPTEPPPTQPPPTEIPPTQDPYPPPYP